MNTRARGRAVVLGGSIAGSLAARVLAETCREVLVVDRDKVLGVTVSRKGAPHTHHAHGLHARGHLILEELFPGLTEDIVATGAWTTDLGRIRWFFNGRRIRNADTGLRTVAPSRPVLEDYVRGRVAALPNVEYLEEHDILRPVHAHGRVTGVLVRRRADDADLELEADLVVDTTGRGSRTPAWLEELGYERPVEDKMTIGLAYTTRHYRVDPSFFDGQQSIVPVASPAHPRGAFFGQLGGGVCVLSLTGMLGDHPPTDPEGFVEFARTLPVPDVYEAIRDASAIEDPVRFRFPASVRRRYEKLTRFPDGLLVLGDAFCSFNPVYGQGMTAAALEVLALRTLLREGEVPPLKFFGRIAKVIKAPWEISTGGDLAYPGVAGPRPAKVKLANAYMNRLQYAATRDAKVTEAFMRVAGLIDPPEALFKPATVFRVLRNSPRNPQPGPSWLDGAQTPPKDLGQAA